MTSDDEQALIERIVISTDINPEGSDTGVAAFIGWLMNGHGHQMSFPESPLPKPKDAVKPFRAAKPNVIVKACHKLIVTLMG